MRQRRIVWVMVAVLLSWLGHLDAAARLELGTPFSHRAVLQCDQALPVWGWTAPQQNITVEFNGQTVSGVSDVTGRWQVSFPPMAANANPQPMKVTSGGRQIILHGVLLGEVWLCAGQSNMGWPVSKTDHVEQEVQRAESINHIRVLRMPKREAADEVRRVRAEWATVSPHNVKNLEAVPWGFAWHLQEKLQVPIGIIVAEWGSTRIQSWLPTSAGAMDPGFAQAIAMDEEGGRPRLRLAETATNQVNEMRRGFSKDGRSVVDPGRLADAWDWHQPQKNLDTWGTMELPGQWEEHGLAVDGAVWFRRTVNVSKGWAGKPLMVQLGSIDDTDEAWFDGQLIGSTTLEDGASWKQVRRYEVPAELVTPGEHEIAVRVWDKIGDGGFRGDRDDLKWYPIGKEKMARTLAGDWRFRVELALPEVNINFGKIPDQTAVVYNGMVSPLVPYAMRGWCWYQGESNASHPQRYSELLPLLVKTWRGNWQREDMHALVVQLPAFGKDSGDPNKFSWARIREAQTAVLDIPHASLAVTIDTGDTRTNHPVDKRQVSQRLAALALKDVYQHAVVARGPQFQSMQVEGGVIRLSFTHADGLTTTDTKSPREFFVAGEDRRWKRVDRASIENNEVVLHSPVKKPLAVRYGWTASPKVNLVNAAGLPAAPFRTDSW